VHPISADMQGRRTFLLPLDGSRHSDAAFRWADIMYPKTDEFVVFHGHYESAVPIPFVPIAMPEVGEVAPPVTTTGKPGEQPLWQQVLDKYKNMCSESRRHCRFLHEPYDSTSDLSRRIVDSAREVNANSIVMGHRGLGGLQRLLVGSTTNAVVNISDVTVTVVKAPER